VPPRLAREVLDLGPPGIARLQAILSDPRAAPALVGNAAFLLGEAGCHEAIPAVVARFVTAPEDSVLQARLLGAFLLLAGPALVEPLLAAPVAGQRHEAATMALAWCKVRDPRIEQRIRALLRSDEVAGAEAVYEYGDPALVPALKAAFEALLRSDRGLDFEDVLSLRRALLHFGEERWFDQAVARVVSSHPGFRRSYLGPIA
jgi:hypothetical protein